jgi:hypothetical protein
MISQSKLGEWVDLYLIHIREITPEIHVREEEGYKFKTVDTFQRNFDLDAPDLAAMLDKAIERNNLTAGAQYLPRRTLIRFAQEYAQETRQALRILFDESGALATRIDKASEAFDSILKRRLERVPDERTSYIGIRFLSTILAFRFPNACNPIKPREWKVFCRFLDEGFRIPPHTSEGEQYEKYEPYIEALRAYIKTLPEIRNLHEAITHGLAFRDDEYRWMAQDLIYVTARVLAQTNAGVPVTIVQEPSAEDEETTEAEAAAPTAFTSIAPGMRFPLEEYLENLIVKNWSQIDFCKDLELFVDEDGTPGQQYTTDVGIIDLLARDKKRGDLVVIELKRGSSDYRVIGQILAYIDWVERNLAGKEQKVRGVVIVAEGNKALFAALHQVSAKVSVRYYRVNLDIYEPAEVA